MKAATMMKRYDKSQKMRRSNPRMSLSRDCCPDVQWRAFFTISRLLELDDPSKVSMKRRKGIMIPQRERKMNI